MMNLAARMMGAEEKEADAGARMEDQEDEDEVEEEGSMMSIHHLLQVALQLSSRDWTELGGGVLLDENEDADDKRTKTASSSQQSPVSSSSQQQEQGSDSGGKGSTTDSSSSKKMMVEEHLTALLFVRILPILLRNNGCCEAMRDADHHAAVTAAFSNLSTTTICQEGLQRMQDQDKDDKEQDKLFVEFGWNDVLKQLRDFVRIILEKHHPDLPFHNVQHTHHVVLSANKLMDIMLLSSSSSSSSTNNHDGNDDNTNSEAAGATTTMFGLEQDPLALFSLLFAALIHNVDYQSPSHDDYGRLRDLYNGQSVAENHALHVSFTELLKKKKKKTSLPAASSPAAPTRTLANKAVSNETNEHHGCYNDYVYGELLALLFPLEARTAAAADMDPPDIPQSSSPTWQAFYRSVVSLVLSTDLSSPQQTQLTLSKWKIAAFASSTSSPSTKKKSATTATTKKPGTKRPAPTTKKPRPSGSSSSSSSSGRSIRRKRNTGSSEMKVNKITRTTPRSSSSTEQPTTTRRRRRSSSNSKNSAAAAPRVLFATKAAGKGSSSSSSSTGSSSGSGSASSRKGKKKEDGESAKVTETRTMTTLQLAVDDNKDDASSSSSSSSSAVDKIASQAELRGNRTGTPTAAASSRTTRAATATMDSNERNADVDGDDGNDELSDDNDNDSDDSSTSSSSSSCSSEVSFSSVSESRRESIDDDDDDDDDDNADDERDAEQEAGPKESDEEETHRGWFSDSEVISSIRTCLPLGAQDEDPNMLTTSALRQKQSTITLHGMTLSTPLPMPTTTTAATPTRALTPTTTTQSLSPVTEATAAMTESPSSPPRWTPAGSMWEINPSKPTAGKDHDGSNNKKPRSADSGKKLGYARSTTPRRSKSLTIKKSTSSPLLAALESLNKKGAAASSRKKSGVGNKTATTKKKSCPVLVPRNPILSKYTKKRLGIRRSMDLSGHVIETFPDSRPATPGKAKGTQKRQDGFKAAVVLETVLAAADVAAYIQGWDPMIYWSRRLYRELHESRQSSSTTAATTWFINQLGFIEMHVLPLAHKLEAVGVYPSSLNKTGEFFSKIVEASRDQWLLDGESITAKMLVKKQQPENGSDAEERQQRKTADSTSGVATATSQWALTPTTSPIVEPLRVKLVDMEALLTEIHKSPLRKSLSPRNSRATSKQETVDNSSPQLLAQTKAKLAEAQKNALEYRQQLIEEQKRGRALQASYDEELTNILFSNEEACGKLREELEKSRKELQILKAQQHPPGPKVPFVPVSKERSSIYTDSNDTKASNQPSCRVHELQAQLGRVGKRLEVAESTVKRLEEELANARKSQSDAHGKGDSEIVDGNKENDVIDETSYLLGKKLNGLESKEGESIIQTSGQLMQLRRRRNIVSILFFIAGLLCFAMSIVIWMGATAGCGTCINGSADADANTRKLPGWVKDKVDLAVEAMPRWIKNKSARD